ncbi:phosphate ABC transporter permease PstA [Thiohalorhabdus methylotrophus]|uniref:Phosphate transport system permease protein PstA n=1 Tax=Thiohalorhabdus methylotrophus TaxID=3242694 RepID=A0ABV4TQK5_9GAMM
MATPNSRTEKLLRRRYRAERRFKALCIGALTLAVAFLVFFFGDIISKGYQAFQRAQIKVEVTYSERSVELPLAALQEDVRYLVSRGFLRQIPNQVERRPALLGKTVTKWVIADIGVDQYLKGKHNQLSRQDRRIVDRLAEQGRAELAFNWKLFTAGDSTMPEMAGIRSAVVGTLYTLLVTMLVSFPIGVMTAVYLEEFASDNRFTRAIEVNINNLAAVPSILYGLLGLAVFINFFGVPRSSALAGGFTLALMTLPIIIISTRAALRAVPDSIREGAFGVGASRLQMVAHHVLPLSLPGILTGSIIGLAQAMGETAPLLIVGMMAFIPSPPDGVMDAATVLPAQIFTWASRPERAFAELTAAGIIVLLAVLLTLNAAAVLLRRRFERRW